MNKFAHNFEQLLNSTGLSSGGIKVLFGFTPDSYALSY